MIGEKDERTPLELVEPEQLRPSIDDPTQAFYQEDPGHKPGTEIYEARKDSAARELFQLFRRIAHEPNYQMLVSQDHLTILHVCPGNGAVTEALLETLEERGLLEKSTIVSVDVDPATQESHGQAGLDTSGFVVTDSGSYLTAAKAEGRRFDLIVGLKVPGEVVIDVAEFLDDSTQPYPYALMTTSSPSPMAEPYTDDFSDYLKVQEWVNQHAALEKPPTTPSTWISAEGYSNRWEINKQYVLGADPSTKLKREQYQEMNLFRANSYPD